MAGISEKLYPPTISGSLPAFYDENGTAKIAVPFSMNRAVNTNEIGGFKLKIKTVQSNIEIITLENNNPDIAIAEGKVSFEWNGFDPQKHQNSGPRKIKLGQYLKVQLAYVSTSNIVGYFSTVGIIKYTSKPRVYIEGLNEQHGSMGRANYIGVFETGLDKSERPYSYSFSLYDNNGILVETTDWLLHNTSINNIASESLSLDKTTDEYSFNVALKTNEEYWVQYSVRTINNLEVSSALYRIAEVEVGTSLLRVNLSAQNYFDDGFILLRFTEIENESHSLSEPVSIGIFRAEKTDNYTSQRLITQAYITSYAKAIEDWSFKDFTVEQGMTYRYCFREYNAAGIQSDRVWSNTVFCDFEDMFLFDGEKQLKIKFNPKVSSFKTTRLETKSDTIGSKYPFIFRNGVVGYKEFPISGLISYKMDDNEMFIKYIDDLNILQDTYSRRSENPINQLQNDVGIGKSWELAETLDSLGYNIRAERVFKLKVMEWLGDGKVKLFRSPTEGNYLVRLINVSLSPEDKLGRMIHNFSANAYEVEECTYNNLYNLGFFNSLLSANSSYDYKTILLRDKIPNSGGAFKINDEPIVGYARLELSPSGENGTPFYIKVGNSDILVIAPGYFLGSQNNNHNITYPDFFYDPTLNGGVTTKADITSLVQDAQLTYMYLNKNLTIGTFRNITDAYFTTAVRTFSGSNALISFGLENSQQKQESIVKFYSLKFRQKDNSNNETGTDIRLYLVSNNGEELIQWNFAQEPILDLTETINNNNYHLDRIYLGNNIELECAYQIKVVEKGV